MVKKLLIATMATAALALPASSRPQSFAVASVAVTHEGQWHEDPNGRQTAEQCKLFKLSGPAARSWFASAKEVDEREWLEQLDWTQCSADGTLVTDGGRTYKWELDQSGRARVVVSPAVSVYLAGPELPFIAK